MTLLWLSWQIHISYYTSVGKPVTLIDTPGFGALEWEFERQFIEQLVEILKTQVKHVDVFVIAVDGNQDRLTQKFITMLKSFADIFSNR